ncbi:MAG: serine hydrolase [Gemmatimonadota bacterium]|nr:serine hydrolase [Gemmatimonadota bacterium]
MPTLFKPFVPILPILIAAGIGVLSTSNPLEAQRPDRDEARHAVGEIAGAAAERGFAGQVLAVRDGELLLHEAFGLSDTGAGTPTSLETVYAIGSVTKQFTRVAILNLEEEGKLDASQPIHRYLEGVPTDKREITLQQLLDMRAGFHEYHDDSGDHQAMNREEALTRILAQDLLFEPGTERAYSNSGYTLLAAIVENVSGMTFPEYVRSALLEPVGLHRVGFHGDALWGDTLPSRGRNGIRFGENAPHTWPSVTWALQGGGGMVASAQDLMNWIQALRGGAVLGPEALARAYRDDGNALYAGGDDFGFQTGVVELADGADFVIVNTNTAADVLAIAMEAAEAMTGEALPFELPREAAVEEEGPEPSAAAPGAERVVVRGGPGGQDGIPDSPRARAAMGFLEAMRAGTDEALVALVNEGFAPAMRDAFTVYEHVEQLAMLRDLIEGSDDVGLSPRGEFVVAIMLQPSGQAIILDLEPSPPHGIAGVRVEGG